MVQGLRADRKTVTRRLVKERQFPAPFHQRCSAVGVAVALREMYEQGRFEERPFPYGQPGDRLWVRETFHVTSANEVVYRADYPDNATARGMENVPPEQDVRWRPSIHMPRWASRLTLEVVSVRVERLHDITDEDAKAEGLKCLSKDGGTTWKYGIPDRDGWPGTDDTGWPWTDWDVSPRAAFCRLWKSINGEASWAANPWVWRVGFRRVP